MRKGFTLPELLFVIVVFAGIIFVAYATIKGTPNLRLFTGIALVAMYLPTTIAGIIHHRVEALKVVAMTVGILLISSKFIV